jgi:hypothetical protein
MTKPKRDWTKIRYYPVSLEKLQQASMKEAAILLLPMNTDAFGGFYIGKKTITFEVDIWGSP